MAHRNIFVSLSQELILTICEELDLNDLKHLRLTCKTLANDVAYLVLTNIRIPAKEMSNIEDVVSDLQFLTEPERAAVYCTRKITFGFCVVPSTLPESSPEHTESESVVDSVNVGVASGDLKGISRDLLIALSSFKAVRTVSWCADENDPLWLQTIIWTAIGLYPNLRHLTIYSTFLKQPLGNFEALDALESINISGDPYKHNAALFIGLSKLYASSPNLTSITIENHAYWGEELDQGLRQLFSCKRRGNLLRHLSLTDVNVPLDEATLFHFGNLTSFKLTSLPYILDDPNLDIAYDIWVAFRQSKIRLQELEVGHDAIADSLNDYLSSFSGLKKLELSVPAFSSRASSEATASNFWSNGFPNHVDTLQEFRAEACYDGQWCFGRHCSALIARCTKLEQLTVSLLPPPETRIKGLDENGLKLLIDTVVAHMPHLTDIGLEVPCRETSRGHRCGTHMYRTRSSDECRLAERIPKYKPAASCRHLPRLTIRCSAPFRVFVGVKGARSNKLAYHGISVSRTRSI